uniref:WD_REPEATS_REGION domain-containing protein n=1 Tax=Syphacia muris TaxID=451379 RepID=A0A0N5AZS2_9BILA
MEASAVDTDLYGEYVCFGGPHRLTIVKPFRTSPVKRHLTTFPNLHTLRWRKEPTEQGSHIAVTSGSNVYIYHFLNGDVKEIYCECAHPYVVNDFDWSPVPYLFSTCSIRDNIKIWDLRQPSPSVQLRSVSGAELTRWSIHEEGIICTATGSDIRLWDLRVNFYLIKFFHLSIYIQPKFPVKLVEAHVKKIKCLVWLPKRPSSFVSSGYDCYIKFWDSNDLVKPFRSIGKLEDPVWKLQFSYSGDEFATLSKRSYCKESFSNTVTVFKTKDPMRFQTLRSKEDDIVDICWRGAVRKRPTDCLFSVSKSGRLRRFEINTLSVADISVPMAASEDDDDFHGTELQLMSNERKLNSGLSSSLSSSQQERTYLYSIERKHSLFSKIFWKYLDLCGSSDDYGFKTYVRVANVGNSIGTELDILSALKAPGLSIGEINYERAVVGFTFTHIQTGKRIRLYLRFKASNAKFHKLLLEIVAKESDIEGERGSTLLELLGSHIAEYKSDGSDDTAIANGLKHLSNFVDALKIFDDDMENASINHALAEKDHLDETKIPSTEIFAAYDDLVPAPRTCGASFNGSGLLVVFGRAGRRKDEVKALPLMFTSDLEHLRRFNRDTKSAGDDNRKASTADRHQIPALSAPNSCWSTPKQYVKSQVCDEDGELFSLSMASSIHSVAKRESEYDLSPKLRLLSSNHPYDLYESSHDTTESMSDMTKVSVSAPLVIVRSQHHSSNSHSGVLADEHFMIAEAKLVSKIVIYDASELLPVSKVLARNYRLIGGTPLQICLHNMKVAEDAGRLDLRQIWSVVELWVRTTIEKLDSDIKPNKSIFGDGLFIPVDDNTFWETHPCGVPMLQDLLDHCEEIGDYQTAAVILCTIMPRFTAASRTASHGKDKENGTLLPASAEKAVLLKTSISAREPSISQLRKALIKKSMPKLIGEKKKNLSSSPSNAPALSTSAPAAVPESPPRKFSFFNIVRKPKVSVAAAPSDLSEIIMPSREEQPILVYGAKNESDKDNEQDDDFVDKVSDDFSPTKSSSVTAHRLVPDAVKQRMSKFLQSYIEMLYRWRIYTKATELMKFSESAPRAHPLYVSYGNTASGRECGRNVQELPFYCAVCHVVVKGLLTTCAACKHGGHIEHLALWFQDNTFCPTGCKCQCLSYR